MTFKYRDGRWPNLIALGYAGGGYILGFYLIMRPALPLNLAGVLLLAHAMVIAAYLFHECAHNTLFARNADNARLGAALNWLTGACYTPYETLRRKHFRHHVDRADVVAFDFRPRLARQRTLCRLLHALEWAYVPAQDIYMHLLALALPFRLPSRHPERARVIVVLLLRGAALAALASQAPRLLLWYPLAWCLMVTVLRFMDAFQHTYAIQETLEQPRATPAPRYDAAFEQRNTFTNLHSRQHPWLNLLTLNFGYHNAHHERPAEPWHRLPALHAAQFGASCGQLIPFRDQLAAFHRHRTRRLLNADRPDSDVLRDGARHFVGVDGVSFLIGH